uniref:Uncharacterized protein n=1 Tax=Oryza punctata TaxID=4537 RepID=A0A0E0LS94_ORYPU
MEVGGGQIRWPPTCMPAVIAASSVVALPSSLGHPLLQPPLHPACGMRGQRGGCQGATAAVEREQCISAERERDATEREHSHHGQIHVRVSPRRAPLRERGWGGEDKNGLNEWLGSADSLGTGSLKRSENTCMVVAYIHPYCAYASLSRYFKEGERDENMHGSCFTRSIEEPVVMCGDRKVIALACEEQVNDQ